MLHHITSGDSQLSLRIVDWFVTHYARAHNVMYWVDDATKKMYASFPENGGQHLRKFHLYLEYRAQLQSYTKMFFDPFRRHERITFVLEADPMVAIESTVGQLNFFRWAMQNSVIDYITQHVHDIEDHMASHQKKGGVAAKKAATAGAGSGSGLGSSPAESASKKQNRVVATNPSTPVTHTHCYVRFD